MITNKREREYKSIVNNGAKLVMLRILERTKKISKFIEEN